MLAWRHAYKGGNETQARYIILATKLPTYLLTDISVVVLCSSLAVIYVVSFQSIAEGVITHITTKLPQQQSAGEALHFFTFAVNTLNISHMPVL